VFEVGVVAVFGAAMITLARFGLILIGHEHEWWDPNDSKRPPAYPTRR
jgi:hypothetical protein